LITSVMRNFILHKRFVLLSSALVVILLSLSLVPIPVFADSGLTISPFGAIALNVTPGEKTTQQIELTLGQQSQAMDIAIDVVGFGSTLDGTAQVIEPAQDTDSDSARSFITINKNTFLLEPGESQNIIATISIPANVGNGGRYALIYIHQLPNTAAPGAQSLSSFNIPVLLTIQGSTLVQTGKITAISTTAVNNGQPPDILTYFQNTGNIHYKVQGYVTVKDAQGQTLDNISIPLSASSILPGAIRLLDITLPSTSATLTEGDTIDAKITLQDGTLLDETASTFPITTQYVPPTTTQFNTPTAVTAESVLSTASTTTDKSTSAMNWVMPLTIVILLIIVVVLVMLLVIRKKR